jgi:hypothetical protein
MLINAEYIRGEADIANNIDDAKRLTPYIDKAEREFIINAIGVKNYKALEAISTDPILVLLLSGGYYNNDAIYFSGLKRAIAYLAYSLFVRNDNVFSTASGFRYKGNAEFSDKVEDRTIVRMANEAEARGLKYLNECISYLKIMQSNAKVNKPSRKRLIVIGD